MSNKSDYSKPRTNLYDYLPDVYKSSVNESVLETTFNRFLSKSELTRVIGFIGQGNPNALVDRQIPEDTPHRQAYQLQPLLYRQIGTIEYMSSWKDIEAELQRLGVDTDDMQNWGSAQSFNWAPPIDYDKLLNYRDYYWYNPDNVADPPQYLTIANPCTRAEAQLDEYNKTVDQFGATFTITALDASTNTIVVDADVDLLFTEGFVFYVTNSTNTTINNRFFTTSSSAPVPNTTRTAIVVEGDGSPAFDDSIVNGEISLEQLGFVFESARDCACNGSLGWDGGQWDDSQVGTLLWNTQLIADISHATEADWITANGTPQEGDLWFDTTNDQLKQYPFGSPTDWVVLYNDFSVVVDATTGLNPWDANLDCEENLLLNQWQEQNKWIHRNQVDNIALAKQAQIPIIEFLSTVQLNGWSETTYLWKYRATPATDSFEDTTAQPNIFELQGVDTYRVEGASNNEFVFDASYGDLTPIFTPGYQFRMTGNSIGTNNTTYTVTYSQYCEQQAGARYETRVVVDETTFTPGSSVEDGIFIPTETSLGDVFVGLHQHWVFAGVDQSFPVGTQPPNPMLAIEVNPPPTPIAFASGSPAVQLGEYVLSLYAQSLTLTTDSFSSIGVASVSTGSPNSWILTGDHVDVFNDPAFGILGGTLVVSGDSGIGVNGMYTIEKVVASGGNTEVVVTETISAAAVGDGEAYVYWNLTFDETLWNLTRVGSNELRFYINDTRQYGTYEELNAGPGSSPPVETCDDFVNAIRIQTPIEQFSTIRVEAGAAACCDIGRENVIVRTNENDSSFNPTTGVECTSLVRYRKLEQIKTQTNQYPLFDIYDVEGDTLNQVSRVFGFQESQDEAVDPYVGRRIVRTGDRRVYYYEQFLIPEDNGILYAYRDTSVGGTYPWWFDQGTDTLYHWTGDTWDRKILTGEFATGTGSPDLTCYLEPIVSDTEPGEPHVSIDGMVWFNTNNNSINISDGSTWTENAAQTAGVIVTLSDPTLLTIWRSGPTDAVCADQETYVPQWVDENRNALTVGDPNGDWEIPDQLYHNVSHENRKVLSSTDLLAHFTSIIDSQEVPPALYGTSASLFHALTDINFGAGGTIKEFNDSYDTFLSSIFVQSVNPLSLYEFAHDAYENAINQVVELFRQDISNFMTNTDEDVIADLSGYIADTLIELYEQNDFANVVYGDSNTYDQATDTGIRNWPATLPFVRLAQKVVPELLQDEDVDFINVRHHDGHLSSVGFRDTTKNLFALEVINATDTRTTNTSGRFGTQSSASPPEDYSDYQSVFGNTTGCYWYQVAASTRVLYRLNVVRIGPDSQPPAVTLPVGSYWYDTTNNRLKVLREDSSPTNKYWDNATPSAGKLTEGNVSAWEVIDLDVLLGETLLEIENRLYAVAPELDELAYDFETTFANNPTKVEEYYEDAFDEYVAQVGIVDPFDNSDLYDGSDPFTWNYKAAATPSPQPVIPPLGTPPTGGTWQDVYQKWYGTPYPHLEPWRLQGYTSRPDWWDDMYADTTGARRWTYDMWFNILRGIVPAGEVLPDGSLSSGSPLTGIVQRYEYVSVNIDGVTHDGFAPDDLLPPLWIPPTAGYAVDFADSEVRSLWTANSQVTGSSADYAYDDAGLEEWRWENSSQYLYDTLKVAFRIDPIRFMHHTIGETFLEVGCLQVDQRSQKVYAHQDAIFHGDLLEDNTVYVVPGTLQWYANYNRFNGYDVSSSNFRPLWTGWTTFLGYQFGTFVDTESFLISNTRFDVTTEDWRIRIKRSPGIEDHWVEAFDVALIQAPPSLINIDTESQWVFDVTTSNPLGRTISYYATQSYIFTANANTDVLTINDTLGRTAPWEDGEAVVVSSDEYLPSPLVANQTYYVSKVADNQYKLSETPGGTTIDILSTGVGNHTIARVARSFIALDGQSTKDKIWYAYELDKETVLTFRPQTRVNGVENLINIIFGYAAYEEDVENFRFNFDKTDLDPDTGRVVNWQLEVERLINWAYQARTQTQSRLDFYEFNVDSSPSNFVFDIDTDINELGEIVTRSKTPQWETGQAVVVYTSAGGTLPDPLLANTTYYYIRIDNERFGLALTAKNAKNGIAITILSSGSGQLFVQQALSRETVPTQEVNPFRHTLWISTPQGIVSNLEQGPFADIRTDQLLYDQDGNRLPSSSVLPLRQDRLTEINIREGVRNPDIPAFATTGYNTLHLSTAHIFIDGYEHVILFDDYGDSGALIYDAFLGLNTPKFDVQFDRGPESTLRPSVGGYALVTFPDVDLSTRLVRNIEGQTTDLRQAYDTYKVIEANDIVEEVRDSLGYDGPYEFLDAIQINPKSQFIFWRGMIQAKGSVNSVNAFINSRRFVDARIDEFWAYKVAEFGNENEISLPELNLFAEDTRAGEIRFHFVDTVGSGDTGFIEVTPTDQVRWYEFPNQTDFIESNGNIYFNIGIDAVDIPAGSPLPYLSTVIGSPYTYFYELEEPADDVVITVTETGSPSSTVLVEGTDYDRLNSRTIAFYIDPTVRDIRIHFIKPYESRHNPCKIRDVVEEVTVAEAILWDPARNNHYHNAIHLVDIQRDDDAAVYEYPVSASTGDAEEVYADTFDPWGQKEVDTTWLDTNELGFLPYSDTVLNASVFDRLESWGRLADWGAYKMYQWTESDVPPDEYDAIAVQQEGDVTINPRIRVTGRTRKVPYKLVDGSPETWEEFGFKKYEVGSRLYYSSNDIDFDVTEDEPASLYKNGELVGTYPAKDGIPVIAVDGSPNAWIIEGDHTATFAPGDDFVVYGDSGIPETTYTVVSVTPELTLGSPLFYGSPRPAGSPQYGSPLGSPLSETFGSPLGSPFPPAEGSPAGVPVPHPTGNTVVVVAESIGGAAADGFVGTNNLGYVVQSSQYTDNDFITVVRYQPTSDQLSDGTAYKEVTPYSTEQFVVNDAPVTKYYFWVENKTVRQTWRNKTLSMLEAVDELESIPVPYVVPENLVASDGSPMLPRRYTQAILRNYGTLINADDRYVLRFTRNFALRDTLDDTDECNTSLKDRHEEWAMFRKEQTFNVTTVLWNKMIEAIIGQTRASLGSTAVRVPSLDKELYDTEYNTMTRIGLGDGQAFCDGVSGWNAIVAYLTDPDNDFAPVDIQAFFEQYDILNLTPRAPADAETINDMLTDIYNTFTFEAVNRMFFSVLETAALPNQLKYRDLLKTSWIALHGIRILETEGIFDD